MYPPYMFASRFLATFASAFSKESNFPVLCSKSIA